MSDWALHSRVAGPTILIWSMLIRPTAQRQLQAPPFYTRDHRPTLTDNGKEPETSVAGETFLAEAGFDGIWKTEETVRKLFAIRVK